MTTQHKGMQESTETSVTGKCLHEGEGGVFYIFFSNTFQ